ncbi:zinc finger Ran-binding domain-containing protein [Streptomyces sp. NPDC058667]|uniref:zinc finger Ran-binding domain-containing protein n=1 Tax=Streptomyces sp. NPDC058667 TaxID=3346588 RepID=UPI0036658642
MAGSAKWKCKDCGSNTEAGAKPCVICESTRKVPIGETPAPAAPTPPRPAARRPSPARPSGDWECSACRATNPARRLDCVGCGKSWRTSGGPAPKKTTPKSTPTKAAPKTTPRTTTGKATPGTGTPPRTSPAKKAAPKKPTPRRTATPRPGTTGGTGARPTGLLYPPPSSTGYTPSPPRATPPPRTPYTPPPYTPPYRPPAKKKSNGCMISCLSVVGGLVLLGILNGGITAIVGSLDEADPKPTASRGPAAAACPSRIASTLPSGRGATLVEAFRTDDHRITLCRTKAGKLYYYGEFRDGREAGITMPAKKTGDGYEATNTPYRYVVSGGTVSIYKSGSRIGREELTPEPSPS